MVSLALHTKNITYSFSSFFLEFCHKIGKCDIINLIKHKRRSESASYAINDKEF